MSARAGIVVTGTEVLTGRVRDRNGPWLSDRLLELGVELAHITICGDRPQDIEAQLRFLAEQDVDLIVTSGGLGPTADDMTVEMVARFTDRELVLDDGLEDKIAAILKPLMARFSHWDFDAVKAANRKQALIPEGAYVIDPVGTAPGVVVPGKPAVVVLPGPPRELQPMWRTAVASEPVREAIAGHTEYRQEMVRMFGLPESGLADTLRDAEEGIDGYDELEITTCLRRGEIEMVTRFEPGASSVYEELVALLRERHGREIFSEDGSSIDDQVVQLLAGRRMATAESCTAGLLAARLTERPGSSAFVMGGVVAYSNEAKVELLGVDPRADRGPRRRVRAGGRRDGRGRAAALRGGHRGGDHGHRGPGRRNARRSRWGRSAGASGPRRAAESPERCVCPATGPTSATARRRWRCTSCGACSPKRGLHGHRRRHSRTTVSGPRARMFLALDLPEDAREPLVRWRDAILSSRTDVRPVRPEALHVTLVFLGWQDESAAERIAEAAFGALPAGPPPRLTADGREAGPAPERAPVRARPRRRGRPRQRLQAAVSDALEAGGWYRPRSGRSGRTSRWRG